METLPKNYASLEKLLAVMDTQAMSHSDFVKAFEVVMQMIRDLKVSNETDFSLIRGAVDALSAKLAADNSDDMQTMRAECDAMMQDCYAQIEEKILAMDAKMDAVEDGKDPTPEDLKALIRPIVEESIVIDEDGIVRKAANVLEENLAAFGIAFRDGLELLPEGQKLSPDAIEGLSLALEEAVTNASPTVKAGWGAHPLTIQQSGTTKAKVARVINFTGATVTLSPSGVVTVAITGGGSGVTVETPTGTVDGSNTAFTTTNTPKWIAVDGVMKFLTLNYTYAANTITITDGAPPVFSIRNFY